MNIEKLEKLCELKEKGLLTASEFEEEKQKLMASSSSGEEVRSKGINWKNVAISFLVAIVVYIITIPVSKMVGNNEVSVFLTSVIMQIFMAIVLTVMACKVKMGRYKNCPSAVAVFIFTLFLGVIAVFFVTYYYLQIEEGCAILKPSKK